MREPVSGISTVQTPTPFFVIAAKSEETIGISYRDSFIRIAMPQHAYRAKNTRNIKRKRDHRGFFCPPIILHTYKHL